ncbi:unnamed protein product [Parnassius mnemosyne]|uniref:PiggyBac transposable element-derived protein domain-containing protein n=1 Tax=Parnassius mnemosyne TaxID=213953 RepID=A0AAV1L816_9NEOP
MDNRAIEDFLNDSDLDFSGDEDDEEYLPPDVLRALQESQEAKVRDESLEEEEAREEVMQDEENTEEVSQSTSRLLWRKNIMPRRGPDIEDNVLISQESADMNVLYCFFEYLGLDFWGLLAEQSNLYSAQKRNLKSINTNSIEMVHFAGIQLMMGTLKYPQGKLYWTRDLCVPIVRDTINRDRFF